ncbi:hypothetical protein OE88DRAFT_1660811 [Heliocybe sulcata]|uniref:Uncharacterized protein n=1 Tax=Heliocybe sulcata TaxID=5364 RepID=A0A5C3N1Z3_9AGAM|nr:hypothetical protein OE88DRAFT_1660811 [Heliocybe sulcata]
MCSGIVAASCPQIQAVLLALIARGAGFWQSFHHIRATSGRISAVAQCDGGVPYEPPSLWLPSAISTLPALWP